MKKTSITLPFLLLATSCGGGSSAPPAVPDPPVAGPPIPAEILAADLQGLTLTDVYFESYKALTHTFPMNDVGLNDLSDTFQRDRIAI